MIYFGAICIIVAFVSCESLFKPSERGDLEFKFRTGQITEEEMGKTRKAS
jgi:hypothetical protein